MRQSSSARCRGLVGQVIVVLLLIAILVVIQLRSRRPPRPDLKQRAQFHSMDAALELHAREFDGYPPSDANDPTGVPYCGALKLAEAVMGRDLIGIHSDSVFRADGLDATGATNLYPDVDRLSKAELEANLKARKGPYLQPENANACRLWEIYGKGHAGPFDENRFVLCDTYIRKRPSGAKTGMPILYYRADPKKTAHDVNDPDNPANIYDYRDNQMLLALGVPGEPSAVHPLTDPQRFYMNTQRDNSQGPGTPYHADKFILISAGYDGLYGTADDICNFQWQYRE